MQKSRAIKKKLLKARIALGHTIQKILDISSLKKRLVHLEHSRQKREEIQEELRVLNKLAAHQARLVRHYESLTNQDGKKLPLRPQ